MVFLLPRLWCPLARSAALWRRSFDLGRGFPCWGTRRRVYKPLEASRGLRINAVEAAATRCMQALALALGERSCFPGSTNPFLHQQEFAFDEGGEEDAGKAERLSAGASFCDRLCVEGEGIASIGGGILLRIAVRWG
jgi:hypothetical protein